MNIADGLKSLFEKHIKVGDKIDAWQEIIPYIDLDLIEDLRDDKYFAQAFLELNDHYGLEDEEERLGIREAWGLPRE